MLDSQFDKVVQEFLTRSLEINPVAGTYLGLHEYDDSLPKGGREWIEANLKLAQEVKEALKDFPPGSLTGYRRVDRELLEWVVDLSIFEHQKIRMWEKYSPSVDVLGGSIYLLMVRDFAPLEARLKSIASRLEQFPEFEKRNRELLKDPVRVWNSIALQSGYGMHQLLDILEEQASNYPSIREEVRASISTTREALNDHLKWLETEVLPRSKDEFHLGKPLFNELLKLRGIPYDADELVEIGYSYLERYKEELKELAHEIMEGASPDEVLEIIKERRPKTFEEALNHYRKSVESVKAFLREKEIVSLPPNEELEVVETPPFLRNLIPIAAYLAPAKYEEVKKGVYMVTRPQSDEGLQEHCYTCIENVTVHEGYPGHHLHLSWLMSHPSVVRVLALEKATEFVEGWAFYCEEMMKDQGYMDDPEHRFMMLVDLLWRAARIVVDVKLQTGEMGIKEAIDFMKKNAFLSEEAATAEVLRYTMSPSQPLSYMLGKHLIMKLRKELEEALGGRFSLKAFHDALMEEGALPWFLMERVVREKIGVSP